MKTESPQAHKPSPRARLSRVWLTVWLLLAAGLGLISLGGRGQTDAGPRATLASVALPAIPARDIEEVRLGDRLAERNPLREEVDESLPEPDPATWRVVSLRMAKESGDSLDIELLRPLEWIEASSAQRDATIHLDLPEMGAVGDAQVLSVGPCPPIKPGNGNVVTGRFVHRSSGNLLNLQLAGQPEPTGVTAAHPYWSEDRQAFVAAGNLRPGEHLDTLFGLTTVVSITPRPSDEPVYNLEVNGEHVYRVGELGTLVHNTCFNRGGRRSDLHRTKVAGEVPHHMPQNAARATSRGNGPALGMSEADHALTRTFSGRGRVTNVTVATSASCVV